MTYVTYLHKTIHKSPNIKWQKMAENGILSKKVKNVLFLVFRQDSFKKNFVFYIILTDSSSICGFFKVRLNDLEICFFLTTIFSL